MATKKKATKQKSATPSITSVGKNKLGKLMGTGVATGKAEKPARKRRNAKVHIREKVAKDSDTFCGGSHSDLWNRKGDMPLESVAPQQASKGTCGRCIRVAKFRKVL